MKLIIRSTQYYGTHTDEFVEEFECSVSEIDNILNIHFSDGFIILEENKLMYERNENKIVIEPNKINECDYETEYGMFILDIKGLSFNNHYLNNKNKGITNVLGRIASARYEIQIVGVEPYENQIEIIIE